MANQILGQDGEINNQEENESNIVVADTNTEMKANPSFNLNPKKMKKGLIISGISVLSVLFLFFLVVLIFSINNNKDLNIKKGVSIENVDISGLSKEDAKNKVQTEFLDKLDNNILFQYGDEGYTLAFEQIDVKYDLDAAIEKAYNIGRTGTIIERDLKVLDLPKHPEDVTIEVSYDKVALDACINDLSAKLPEQVIQPSYYTEDGKLIITSGKVGKTCDVEGVEEIVHNALNGKDYNEVFYDIPTEDEFPDEIDVDQIHSEIYKEVKDAYYTVEPRMVYVDETGVDFAEDVETVKQRIAATEQEKYEVELKFTPANVTVNDLGFDAFPDQLATFSTAYVNNYNRTINLSLASNKINGKVLMPGETFSYNNIVGERTWANGFRNAAIYENGQVVDGLGGGICQVSSTLYQAILRANLEVVERTNHMFLTSYLGGGLDATVAYGSLDFKFKNNRNYPIKIVSSVGGGYCTVQIYGLRTEDDYDIKITTSKIGARTYQAYKQYYKNGAYVGSELISTDSYSAHT